MNWGLLWVAIRIVVFWFFLFGALLVTFNAIAADQPRWQDRAVVGTIFLSCLIIAGFASGVLTR